MAVEGRKDAKERKRMEEEELRGQRRMKMKSKNNKKASKMNELLEEENLDGPDQHLLCKDHRGKAYTEPWEGLPKTRSGGRTIKKKNIFQKAGGKEKLKKAATTVVSMPSTRGSTLIRSLREEEDKMAEITGFRVKYQEAGGSILANAFNKNLGIGQQDLDTVSVVI